MDTTPALDAALAQERATLFIAIKAELPTRTVRILDGAGEVTWSEGNFVAADPVFGVASTIEAITDGMDEQAPVLSMTFLPTGDASVAELAAPEQQGSRIRIWIGALDGSVANNVVADPYLLFDGVLDVPVLNTDDGTRSVEMTCASNFERLFMDDEGIRLNPASHKDFWPGETGLDDVTGVVRQVLWGPGDPIVGSAPGSGYGGAAGGYGGGGGREGRYNVREF